MLKDYTVTLQGIQPLIMHRDNIIYGEKVKAWQRNPDNKKIRCGGDDRTPAWTWIGYLYHDQGEVVIDADNIMTILPQARTTLIACRTANSISSPLSGTGATSGCISTSTPIPTLSPISR